MKRLIWIGMALCLLLAPRDGRAGDGPGNGRAKPLEKLVFTAHYNWAFIWIEAGILEFTLSPSTKYPRSQCLFVVGRSTKDWIFRVRDTLVSHHDSVTFLPHEFSRRAHEGNYHKIFDYRWDYPHHQIYSRQEKIGRYVRHDTIPLKPTTYDMLSVAWMMREFNFAAYQKDDRIPIRILLDDRVYDLHVRYLGRERIKWGKGRRWCHVFSPLLVEGEVFKGGEGMKVWVSDDDERLPIMAEAKLLVGSIKAVLSESKSQY
jgi:hypothetical protein